MITYTEENLIRFDVGGSIVYVKDMPCCSTPTTPSHAPSRSYWMKSDLQKPWIVQKKKSVNQIIKAFYHDCIGRHQFRASGDEMKSIVTNSNRKLTMGPTAAAHYGTNSGGSEKWLAASNSEKKASTKQKAFYHLRSRSEM